MPPKLRDVVRARLFEGNTLTEVRAGLGPSRERARQLEAEALAMLRPLLWDVADLASAA